VGSPSTRGGTPAGGCARYREVHAFADGELPEEERLAFLEHHGGCLPCQRELEEILALRALIETLPGDEP
jgi:anti-sigma factor RsiW